MSYCQKCHQDPVAPLVYASLKGLSLHMVPQLDPSVEAERSSVLRYVSLQAPPKYLLIEECGSR